MADKDKKYNVPSMNTEVFGHQSSLVQNQDLRDGRDAIITNAKSYIPELDGQTPEQYVAMVKRTPIYTLYPKIVDGFIGIIFAKPPIIKNIDIPENNKNIDLLGNSLDKLSQSVCSQVLENGFCATINDYSDGLKRSFIRMVNASQFVSYRVSSKKGYPEVTQFIYKEEIDEELSDDEFSSEVRTTYTVLDMAEIDIDGTIKNVYRVRTFKVDNASDSYSNDSKDNLHARSNPDKSEMTLITSTIPKMNGNTFDKIPIQIHSSDINNFSLNKSPLQDLSDMNISIIQRTVDQVHLLHYTALPTPYIIGMNGSEDNAPDSIGPAKLWFIDNDEAEVGILEFTGKAAAAHQEFIDELKLIMAVMGAQILKKEGVSRETATSVIIRTASQTSIISSLVENVSKQIENTYKIHLEWDGETIQDNFSYGLNKDFIRVDMEPNAQIALVKSWLDGAISFDTMFNKFKEGEIVNQNKTVEQEKELIKSSPPPFFKERLIAELKPEPESDDTKGSNLETTTEIDNPLATEQA